MNSQKQVNLPLIPSLVLLLCFSLFSSSPAIALNNQPQYPVLIFDVQGDPNLPANFRTSKTAFPKETENPPPRLGLDELNASGSGQFTGTNVKKMLKEIPAKNGYIIDLRKEFHDFLDNIPVSWYGFRNLENKDRVASTVNAMEKKLLYTLGTQRKAIVYQRTEENEADYFKPRNITFREVRTEEELINGNTDFQYFRLYVLDHYPPDSSQVDAFVKLVKSLPASENTWLHFHCHAGKGRTTTFLAMYDMIRNANQVSFEDIVKRQYLIGGGNLLNTTEEGSQEWKVPVIEERLAFLKNFYDYVKDKEGYAARSFSDWEKKQAKAKKSRFSILGL